MFPTLYLFALLITLVRSEEVPQNRLRGKIPTKTVNKPKSCYQYLLYGVNANGFYQLFDYEDKSYTAFCDFTSERGHAYTLVMSFTLENSERMVTKEFRTVDLVQNRPVNAERPNWYAYRMPKPRMEVLRNESEVMRYTCSSDGTYYRHSYRDYVRVSLKVLNPLQYLGYGQCFVVEYINIRGSSCANCNIPFYQTRNGHILHTDLTSGIGCNDLSNPIGRVESEDNFGYYATVNREFRCTRSPRSTTNLWFGK